MCRKLFSIMLVLTVVVAWSGAARATDDSAKGAARELANEAKRDFDAGRFEEAGRKFQRAFEVAKVPTLAVWAARALTKRGHLVVASELYRQALHLTPNDLWVGKAQQQAQTDAAKELEELQPRIPRLRIRVEGAAANDVEVTIDDAKIASALLGIAMPTDPGRRHVVGRRDAEIVDQTIVINESESKEALLIFTARQPVQAQASVRGPGSAPAAEPGSVTASTPATQTESGVSDGGAQRTWGWVVTGVGVAGLVTGAVAGILVLSKSGLRKDCPDGTCNPDSAKSGDINSYNLMRTLSTTGFIVGAVGTAVGVTLLLWTPKQESGPHATLWLGPGSAAVKGTF
jgi:hypothetical protein